MAESLCPPSLIDVDKLAFYVAEFKRRNYVYAILYCLVFADLWSPVGKRADLLALLYVVFICVFCHIFHTVSWVRCGT